MTVWEEVDDLHSLKCDLKAGMVLVHSNVEERITANDLLGLVDVIRCFDAQLVTQRPETALKILMSSCYA